jgi:TatA/E family protein of Tat protein translocase
MGIGSLGMTELVAIFIIVLVAFGPRRFPEIARSMGSAMREFRRSLNQIQRELEEVDPRKDIPGRDILNDIRSGKPGNWLDPNRTSVPTTTPGARTAPEAPAPGPEVTGEAAGAAGAAAAAGTAAEVSQEVSAEPAADLEQLPMFDGSTTDAPSPPAVGEGPAADEPPTEGSRSD